MVAVGYLAFAVARARAEITLGVVAVTVVAIALSWWVRTVIVTLYGIVDLWLLGSGASQFLHELLHATADRPADVFGARIRTFLLYVLPVGALTQVPASIVLGHYTLVSACAASAWLIVVGIAVISAWNASFRRYESAMG